MFFKNLYIFAFTRPFTTLQEELEIALRDHRFTPCMSTDLQYYGWTTALGNHSDLLAHENSGNILLCARKEEKILPAQVIKDEVDSRVEQLEVYKYRSASKKEREQIKEGVVFELLPRAFSRVSDTHGYINAKENIIVINSASRGKAEDFLALLRKSLGTLPVTSFSPAGYPCDLMTNWVIDADRIDGVIGDKFTVGMEAHFNSLGDQSASAAVKNQDLSGAEVKAHLDAEQYVTKIELEFEDCMSFILADDLSIKRLKFKDVILEQNDDIDKDDLVAKLDADFCLMSGELNRMIGCLLSEFSIDATSYLQE